MHQRLAVHYRVMVRHGGIERPGVTENLSERGSMLSVDIDPPLVPGDDVELEIELPEVGPTQQRARVQWTSSVLPGMTGVEFTPPVAPELLGHLAQLAAAQPQTA